MSRNAPSAPPNYQFMGGTPQGGMMGGTQAEQPINQSMKPMQQVPPQQQAPAPQGAYPMSQQYRQYLQQPVQGGGAHMAYNQFVESQGGPSPGMQASGAGMTGAPTGGASGAPVDPNTWNAYRALQQPNGKGWGANGTAAMQFAQQYGTGYDPEGILSKVQALRAQNPKNSGSSLFSTLARGGLPGKLGDISARSVGGIGNTTAAGSPFIGGAIKKGMKG